MELNYAPRSNNATPTLPFQANVTGSVTLSSQQRRFSPDATMHTTACPVTFTQHPERGVDPLCVLLLI
jgi:hypothetical protein